MLFIISKIILYLIPIKNLVSIDFAVVASELFMRLIVKNISMYRGKIKFIFIKKTLTTQG